MQRKDNIQISSLLVICSILTILLQIASYCIFGNYFIVLIISALLCIVSCHMLLEKAASFQVCFDYSILTLFITLLITILTYNHTDYPFLPGTSLTIGIAMINWFIPIMHCFIRYMLNYSSHLEDYPSFYRNSSIFFIVAYLLVLSYGAFVKDAFPLADQMIPGTYNFIPFWSLSSLINEYLYKDFTLNTIFIYLCSRIIIFIPYGFYCKLLLRGKSKLMGLAVLFVLPLLIELFQGIYIPSRCDIDDIIFGVIGGLFGIVSYYLINFIFNLFSGKDFLAKESGYHFSNSTLHF